MSPPLARWSLQPLIECSSVGNAPHDHSPYSIGVRPEDQIDLHGSGRRKRWNTHTPLVDETSTADKSIAAVMESINPEDAEGQLLE